MTERAQPRPPKPDPLIGQVLAGRFEIQGRIGRGGMGVVYRARQLSVDRIVAIKVLGQNVADDGSWVQRFHNEARAASRLQHPNTIRVLDFGQADDGRLFIAMEFLEGRNLRDELRRGGPLAPARVARILAQACSSLAEAHHHGVLHRDIKPDNLFLVRLLGTEDFVKVLDFSVAKLLEETGADPDLAVATATGLVFGTPQYMAPEQCRGQRLDARSDLYALGIVGYEMLTGKAPFDGPVPGEILVKHVRDPVAPLPDHVPPAIARAILRALEKEPAARPQNADQLRAELEAALTGEAPPREAGPVPAAAAPEGVARPLPTAALGAVSPPSQAPPAPSPPASSSSAPSSAPPSSSLPSASGRRDELVRTAVLDAHGLATQAAADPQRGRGAVTAAGLPPVAHLVDAPLGGWAFWSAWITVGVAAGLALFALTR